MQVKNKFCFPAGMGYVKVNQGDLMTMLQILAIVVFTIIILFVFCMMCAFYQAGRISEFEEKYLNDINDDHIKTNRL